MLNKTVCKGATLSQPIWRLCHELGTLVCGRCNGWWSDMLSVKQTLYLEVLLLKPNQGVLLTKPKQVGFFPQAEQILNWSCFLWTLKLYFEKVCTLTERGHWQAHSLERSASVCSDKRSSNTTNTYNWVPGLAVKELVPVRKIKSGEEYTCVLPCSSLSMRKTNRGEPRWTTLTV